MDRPLLSQLVRILVAKCANCSKNELAYSMDIKVVLIETFVCYIAALQGCFSSITYCFDNGGKSLTHFS